MSDITKCSGEFSGDKVCPIRDTCYRFKAPECDFWQSIFVNSPGEFIESNKKYNFECNHYWKIKTVRK
ncbi:MAG: hypothetical protein AB1Z17_07285 [Lutibacter sp.]